MVLTGPGVIPGTLHHQPSSLFDVYPTVLDLAGLAARNPANLAGSSILPLAQGKPAQAGRKDYIVSCVKTAPATSAEWTAAAAAALLCTSASGITP